MLTVSPDTKLVGVDGARGGWCAVWRTTDGLIEGQLYRDIQELYSDHRDAGVVAIDIPIGLPDADNQVRACDTEARKRLGNRMTGRVFSPPTRAAMQAGDYQEACQRNGLQTARKISLQSWNITPKIREVDEFLRRTPQARDTWIEAHPELAFSRLNGGTPIFPPKHSVAGRAIRMELLQGVFTDLPKFLDQILSHFTRSDLKSDDLIDALGLLAMLVKFGDQLEILPEGPVPTDGEGLPQRMLC